MAEIVPTRGAALALAEEKRFLETGYELLDEKRMLLATTLLGELADWRAARADYRVAMAAAVAALKAAVARHGLDSLGRYPSPVHPSLGLALFTRNFLGLDLLALSGAPQAAVAAQDALDASLQAEDCRQAFAALVPLVARIALHSQNIRRLIAEYRVTERRARALQNVILPETVTALALTTDYLDQSDQEEAVRIRNARR
ncbi:V-type ATP synthase subunit D [Mesobacterium sp. TK19101]|uniref:V-type ATP synthase subunit D n=1 Tax=Mesobacterium hydrothermale TaxID=3111907 RepID=A0ABU6HK03_9RHOB|nr:V-type ATP synthase subunit D [Mesobacterium sp. TK19101]MEC3862788.1 V-type ATP synthase subunit D [Mesobacterium sp. TK19101]